jgi:3-dehydroquinate synthase
VVKYGVILDPELFAWLERNATAILQRDPDALQHIIVRSCELKAQVVEQDEREETGLRAILNYGHTFAHAFETIGGYGAWLHGEAVAAGMVCAARLAERLGRIDAELGARQRALLQAFGLPTEVPTEWPAEQLVDVMRRDKKAEAGNLRFILPTRLGHVETVAGVQPTQVVAALHEIPASA